MAANARLTDIAQQNVLEWLAAQQQAMLDLLARLVNQDSGSFDKRGVDAAGTILRDFFSAAGIEIEVTPNDTYGELMRVLLPQPAAQDQRDILLMGHRDTVFGSGEATRRPFRIDGDNAFGPGVADMKAGLVMNAFVLAAFKRFGGHPGPLVALITADEEISSPSSRAYIEVQGRRARAAFNSEPSPTKDIVVVARKGGVFMTVEIFGKAAHAGAAPKDGISAIEELARKVVRLHALTDFDKGVTVNVGMVSGGQSVNTIAPYASARIDLRYVHCNDREAALAAVRRVIETAHLEGTHATLTIDSEREPLEITEESTWLLAEYKMAGQVLGLDVQGISVGGGADSAITAAQGCPTLCSVGPVGHNGHSDDEYIEVSSLVPRAQLLALAIARLPSGLKNVIATSADAS
ncbi:M20 family metallopeptidase [Hyphomicrobium sp.]|uniref:M20 family metallopeptidase n=1 Tax=Hyphomicrobium sp. TaxID=82 RepID=UPI003F6EA0CA